MTIIEIETIKTMIATKINNNATNDTAELLEKAMERDTNDSKTSHYQNINDNENRKQ